jgi:hypothetical protein
MNSAQAPIKICDPVTQSSEKTNSFFEVQRLWDFNFIIAPKATQGRSSAKAEKHAGY